MVTSPASAAELAGTTAAGKVQVAACSFSFDDVTWIEAGTESPGRRAVGPLSHTPGWDFYDVAVAEGSTSKKEGATLHVRRQAPIRLVRIFSRWPSSEPPLAVALRPEGVGVAEVALPAPAAKMARLLVAVCPSGDSLNDVALPLKGSRKSRGEVVPNAAGGMRTQAQEGNQHGESLFASVAAAAAAADAEAADFEVLASGRLRRPKPFAGAPDPNADARVSSAPSGGWRNRLGSSTRVQRRGSASAVLGEHRRSSHGRESRKSAPAATLAEAAAEVAAEMPAARGHSRRNFGEVLPVLAAAEEAAREAAREAAAAGGRRGEVLPVLAAAEEAAREAAREAAANGRAGEACLLQGAADAVAAEVAEAATRAAAAADHAGDVAAGKPAVDREVVAKEASNSPSSVALPEPEAEEPAEEAQEDVVDSCRKVVRARSSPNLGAFEDDEDEASRLLAELEEQRAARELAEASAKKLREERDDLLRRLRCAERAQMLSDMQVRTLTNEVSESRRKLQEKGDRRADKAASPASLEDIAKDIVTLELEQLKNCSPEERVSTKRRLLLRWHPDKNGGSGGGGGDLATRVVQEMQGRPEWNEKA